MTIKEEHMKENSHFVKIIRMLNEIGEYEILAITIQRCLIYDSMSNKDKLKSVIENVDPDPIIEWFVNNDVDLLPVVINLFNEHGKYQSLEL